MRFTLIVIFVVFAALLGLFIYGQMLAPKTQLIEQEAINANG